MIDNDTKELFVITAVIFAAVGFLGALFEWLI
jgi:hypothetical protein